MNAFLAELKRRHVVRVGIVYAAVAFVARHRLREFERDRDRDDRC